MSPAPSEAAAFFALGHSALSARFPATVKLGGQVYSGASSGLRSENEMKNGDFIAVRKISFEVPKCAFTQARQPDPRPDMPLEWLEGQMTLLVESVLPDPTLTTFVLRCTAPPQ
jgi:hypothetical protein